MARMGEFPGWKPVDGCKFFTKNPQMGHNFDIILPGNAWFSSEWNKIYCTSSVVNFYCKWSENGSVFGLALVCRWVNFPILWPHTLVQMKFKCPLGVAPGQQIIMLTQGNT